MNVDPYYQRQKCRSITLPHLPPCGQLTRCFSAVAELLVILLSSFELLHCIDLYYWLVLLLFAYTPQSQVSTGLYLFSSPTCLLVFVFLLQEGCSICVLTLCIITYDFVFWCALLHIEHWHLLLPICLLPQLLRAVAPALTLITSFKLRQVWCFASYCWLIVGWLWCSLCCPVPYFYFWFLNYLPIHSFIW